MEQTAVIAGRRVRVLDAGSGEPVLLVHGFPLCADMWQPQLDAAPAGWRVIAPDLRGFGGSSGADAVTTIDGHAADVLALADHLGLERLAIVGLSMGGYVAMAIARLAPERLRALVLCDTRAEADTEEGRENRERMRQALRAAGAAVISEAMIPRLLGTTSQRERQELGPRVREWIERQSPAGIEAALVALMTRSDASERLRRVTCPTLIVAGEEDALTPVETHERLHALIPGSRLEVIARAGHLSNLERPDAFNAVLHRFLGGLREE